MRLVSVWLCVWCAVAHAGPKKDAATLRAELEQCKQDVAEVRQALDSSKDLEVALKAGKVLYFDGRLLSADILSQWLLLRAATGDVKSKDDLKAFTKNVAKYRAAAVKAVGDVIQEAEANRDKLDGKCGKLAEDLRAASAGGGGGGDAKASEPGIELTISAEGASQTRNLKTQALKFPRGSPPVVAHVQSGNTYTVTVETSAPVPDGYTIYIIHHSMTYAVLSPTGGQFTVHENKGFGAGNDAGAVVCVTGGKKGAALPSKCLPGEATDLEFQWKP